MTKYKDGSTINPAFRINELPSGSVITRNINGKCNLCSGTFDEHATVGSRCSKGGHTLGYAYGPTITIGSQK